MRRARAVAGMAAGLCAIAATVAAPRRADAYEFWMRAQSIGQIYEVRDYSLVGPDLILGRHIVTQTLALRITDIGDLAHDRLVAHLPNRGLRISFQSYLRIDHDFGQYTAGQIRVAGQSNDAIDVIPELAEQSIAFQLMYGYLALDGLLDDRLTAQIGRVVDDDGWNTSGVDGARARMEIPGAPVAVTALGGLAVRASSPLGVSAYELDGTSGAGCEEYVEGPRPGTGSWQLIDRNRNIVNVTSTSDFAYCPQRDVNQPTVGVELASVRIPHLDAEVGYRRVWSDTVGLIGPVDRLAYPDLGLYPNDYGQAPSSGVNEERLWARARAQLAVGDTSIAPYADLRYSIVNAVVDRGDVGVRIGHGDSVIEPSVEYFFPTFDSDSIFNAFSLAPTTDVRLGYQYGQSGPVRANASAWARHYADDDGESNWAGGFDATLQRRFEQGKAQISALADDGYGGRRVGGTIEGGWRPWPDLWVRAREIVLDVRDDELSYRTGLGVVTTSTVASGTYRLADFAALHIITEADDDRIHALQLRAMCVLDLAFIPEM